MKKFDKKSIALSIASVATAATLLFGGTTYAYLQGQTDDVVNTFKTNQVDVKLDETTGSDYEIIPGTTQDKDPTVTVTATIPAYVYVEVTDKTDGLVGYTPAAGWNVLKEEGNTKILYREVAASETAQTFSVLEGDVVTYDKALQNSDMIDPATGELKKDVTLTFNAYAIQKIFDDPLNNYTVKDTPTAQNFADIRNSLKTANSKVILTNDVSYDATDLSTVQTNQKLQYKSTLNLADKTVKFTQSSDGKNFAPFYLMGGKADVTIEGTGTIESNGYCVNVAGSSKLQNPKLTINGGTYKGVTTCIQVQIGTAYINGGFFEVEGDATYLLNCIDANYPKNAKIIVTGGTFVNFDPSNNAAEGAGTNFVADGYTVVSESQTNGDIWYTVVPATTA